jgi:hypothetical protein
MLPRLALKDAQFCRPVGQRQAEPLNIRVAGEKLGLDRCDFLSASVYS